MPDASWYRFPLSALQVDDPYQRWLISLCHAANDAQLFIQLWSTRPEANGEPDEIRIGDRRSIFLHGMAHTFECLNLLFSPDPTFAETETAALDVVFEKKRAEEGRNP